MKPEDELLGLLRLVSLEMQGCKCEQCRGQHGVHVELLRSTHTRQHQRQSSTHRPCMLVVLRQRQLRLKAFQGQMVCMACVAEPVKKRDRTHRIACVKQCVCTSAFSYDACCSIFARHEHGTHLPRQLLSTLKLPPVQAATVQEHHRTIAPLLELTARESVAHAHQGSDGRLRVLMCALLVRSVAEGKTSVIGGGGREGQGLWLSAVRESEVQVPKRPPHH